MGPRHDYSRGSDQNPFPGRAEPPPPAPWAGWWVGPALAAWAAWLYYSMPAATVPLAPAATVARSSFEPEPLRSVLTDPPRIEIGPYEFSCNECHRLFRGSLQRVGPLAQHTHIRLDHGLNDRCFNCHDRVDRERLTLRDGERVGFVDAPALCAQCHGTTFRDWERGMHGKHLGAWSASVGTRRQLLCTECHDPHHPAYPDFTPLPPPRTLRMAEPSGHESAGRRSPLGQWRPRHPPTEESH